MTKNVFSRSLTALLLISASMASTAYAAQEQATGMINFYGAVVHPACTNNVTDTKIELSCLNDSADTTTSNIELNNVTHIKGWNVINNGRNEFSYNWINEEKQLGMLTIKYI